MDLIRLDGVECGAMAHQDPIGRANPLVGLYTSVLCLIYLFIPVTYVHVQTSDIFNLLISIIFFITC